MTRAGLIAALTLLAAAGALPAAAQAGHQKPQVEITSPQNGATLNSATLPVTVRFAAGLRKEVVDDRILRIDLYADKAIVASFDVPPGTDSGTWTFPSVTLPPPPGRAITLVARGLLKETGNRHQNSDPVLVTVQPKGDTLPPQISGLTPTGSTANPLPTLSAQVSDTGGSGVDTAGIVLRLDGAVVVPQITPVNANLITLSYLSAPLGQGTHSFTVDARDLAGNAAATATASFLVDLAPPTIAISAPAPNSTGGVRPPFAAQVADTGGAGLDSAEIAFRIDGTLVPGALVVPVNPDTLNVSFTPASNLAGGVHVYSLTAQDRVGNPSIIASVTFTVDADAPTITLLAPVDGSSVENRRPPLQARIDEAAGGSGIDLSTLLVQLDGGAVTPVVTPNGLNIYILSFTPGSDLAPGGHSYVVSVKDLAGNPASKSTAFTIIPPAVVLTNASPVDGGFSSNPNVFFTGTLRNNAGTGFLPGSIVARADGAPVPVQVGAIDPNSVSLQVLPQTLYSRGLHTLSFGGRTGSGSLFPDVQTTFIVDLDNPVATFRQPAFGAVLNTAKPTVVGSIDDPPNGAGVDPAFFPLTVNGINVPGAIPTLVNRDSLRVTWSPPSPLADGPQVIALNGRDRSGRVGNPGNLLFVIDTQAPQISISSPLPAPPYPTTSVPFSATVSDLTTGVNLADVHVVLNGAEVSSTVQIAPQNPTPQGGFQILTLTGVLTATAGTNTLQVSARDAAGNLSQLAMTFETEGTTPPPATGIVLTVVAGDAQSGLAGRGAQDNLTVLASDAGTGAPLPGVLVMFIGMENGGSFAKTGGAWPPVTDGRGQCSVRYVYSADPGQNVIRAQASGFPDSVPADFHLTGAKPGLEDISAERKNPCNTSFSSADFPGSALSRLFVMKATKPNGDPLVGELVEPRALDSGFNLPPVKIGDFLPRRALTNDSGEVTFAFVIDPGAQPGDFQMRFALSGFVDEDGKLIKKDIGGTVFDSRFKPKVQINQDEGFDQSGQSQVGQPGRTLPTSLRSISKDTDHLWLVTYTVIEGSGAFGTITEGRFVDSPGDCSSGSSAMRLEVDNDGKAGIQFIPSSPIVLIGIDGGHSDVFAVSAPELSVLSADGTIVPNVFPVKVVDGAGYRYKLQARVPKGSGPPATTMLKAFNSFDEPVFNVAHQVAATALNPSLSLSNSKAQYDEYTSAEFSVTDELAPMGSTPTGGAAINFVQMPPMGGVMAEMTVGTAGPTKMQVRYARLVKSSVDNNDANIDKRGLIFNKVDRPGGINPSSELFRFQFSWADKLTSVKWDLHGQGYDVVLTGDDAKSEIFVKFGEADDINGRKGTKDDPVTLAIPENNGNRRFTRKIKAEFGYTDVTGRPETTVTPEITLRVALNSKIPAGAVNPPEASQNGLDSVADWVLNPPLFLWDPKGNPPAPAYILQRIPADVNLGTHPLSFTTKVNDFLGKSFVNVRTYEPYGTIIPKRTFDYDRPVLVSTINHERRHLQSSLDARNNLDSSVYSVMSHLLNDRNYTVATVSGLQTQLDHAGFILDDLLDDGNSYRSLNDQNSQSRDGGAGVEAFFVQCWNSMGQIFVAQAGYAGWADGNILGSPGGIDLGAGFTLQLKEHLTTLWNLSHANFPELDQKDEVFQTLLLIRLD